MLKLRDIMTREVITVAPELPLAELVELFSTRHIGGAPVVSGKHVVGVVSATDLLTFALRSVSEPRENSSPDVAEEDEEISAIDDELMDDYFQDAWDAAADSFDRNWDELSSDGRSTLYEFRVSDAMSNNVLSLPPDTSVPEAANFMKKSGIHRLLVMEKGELRGIVSSMDIVNAVARQQIPEPQIVTGHEADFDSGWSHEPVVPEAEP